MSIKDELNILYEKMQPHFLDMGFVHKKSKTIWQRSYSENESIKHFLFFQTCAGPDGNTIYISIAKKFEEVENILDEYFGSQKQKYGATLSIELGNLSRRSFTWWPIYSENVIEKNLTKIVDLIEDTALPFYMKNNSLNELLSILCSKERLNLVLCPDVHSRFKRQIVTCQLLSKNNLIHNLKEEYLLENGDRSKEIEKFFSFLGININ